MGCKVLNSCGDFACKVSDAAGLAKGRMLLHDQILSFDVAEPIQLLKMPFVISSGESMGWKTASRFTPVGRAFVCAEFLAAQDPSPPLPSSRDEFPTSHVPLKRPSVWEERA